MISDEDAVSLQTRSVVDAVEDAVRDRILRGLEGEGATITEAGVAAQFGVGRPTARMALERFVTDGILLRDGRRGLILKVMSRTDIVDLYESRTLIEAYVHAQLAAKATVPAQASQQNDMLRLAARRDDARAVVAADVAFHQQLVHAYGHSRIVRMHASLMAEAHVCMARVQASQLLRAEEIGDEHTEILEAIASGDSERSRALTAWHLQHARDKLLGQMFSAGSDEGQLLVTPKVEGPQ
jgi:DNA-binding GntR family transcriptional regulator